MECFSWVNTILGNLKNAINGTYHAFDFEKYAHRYLGEYQYRFNRRFDLAAMLPMTSSGSPPSTDAILRDHLQCGIVLSGRQPEVRQ